MRARAMQCASMRYILVREYSVYVSRAASGLENVSIRHFLRAIGGARQKGAES